jgi:hypothetical protein
LNAGSSRVCLREYDTLRASCRGVPFRSTLVGMVKAQRVKYLVVAYGQDFPGGAIRVLKAKAVKHFGEHRTRRLVPEESEMFSTDFETDERMSARMNGDIVRIKTPHRRGVGL